MFYILLVYIYDVQLTSVGLAQARPNDAYMKELNAVVLYAVIFVPGQFLLASVLLIPVLVRHTARN